MMWPAFKKQVFPQAFGFQSGMLFKILRLEIEWRKMASFAMFYSFQNLGKALQMFSLKKSSQKTFFFPKFVIDTIN